MRGTNGTHYDAGSSEDFSAGADETEFLTVSAVTRRYRVLSLTHRSGLENTYPWKSKLK